MATDSAIQIEIRPEASDLAMRKGVERELDEIVDYCRRAIPHLESLRVEVFDRIDEFPAEPGITIWADLRHPEPHEDQSAWEFDTWMIETYPPRVNEIFAMLPRYLNDHGR